LTQFTGENFFETQCKAVTIVKPFK